jgi:hypothetical protein
LVAFEEAFEGVVLEAVFEGVAFEAALEGVALEGLEDEEEGGGGDDDEESETEGIEGAGEGGMEAEGVEGGVVESFSSCCLVTSAGVVSSSLFWIVSVCFPLEVLLGLLVEDVLLCKELIVALI